jgi:YVTN family beta-propeller protein
MARYFTRGGVLTACLALVPSMASSHARELAYVTNSASGTISVIDTAARSVTGIIPFPDGRGPIGVAIAPDGSLAYVTNFNSDNISVVDVRTDTVLAAIPLLHGSSPAAVTLTPDGRVAYVANFNAGLVAVVDTVARKLSDVVQVGQSPIGLGLRDRLGDRRAVGSGDRCRFLPTGLADEHCRHP